MCKTSIKQINDKPKNNENVPPILDIKPNNSICGDSLIRVYVKSS